MRFRMFSTNHSPIAIDFGATSVKLLQVEVGDKPNVLAAVELPIPDDVRDDQIQHMTWLENQLPGALKSGSIRGHHVVCSVPPEQTIVQHLQVAVPDGARLADVVKSQIHISMGLPFDSLVVRVHEVGHVHRDSSGGGGGGRTEAVCLAIPRDVIMRYIALLEKCRLEVTGVHAQPTAIVRAFDHIHRRAGDENLTTMYVDLGYSCTCVAVSHGSQLTFARTIQIGGRHFDQLIAKALRSDLAGARAHRLSLADPTDCGTNVPGEAPVQGSEAPPEGEGLVRLAASMQRDQGSEEELEMQSPDVAAIGVDERRRGVAPPVIAKSVEPGEGHTTAANVDFSEVLETITDEMSMCLRYHRGLFPNRTIDRVVLLGGEARQNWLCRHVAKALRLPARLGDPLARFTFGPHGGGKYSLDNSKPQPGWSTVCGLCAEAANPRA